MRGKSTWISPGLHPCFLLLLAAIALLRTSSVSTSALGYSLLAIGHWLRPVRIVGYAICEIRLHLRSWGNGDFFDSGRADLLYYNKLLHGTVRTLSLAARVIERRKAYSTVHTVQCVFTCTV
jgi:hypothetical protein